MNADQRYVETVQPTARCVMLGRMKVETVGERKFADPSGRTFVVQTADGTRLSQPQPTPRGAWKAAAESLQGAEVVTGSDPSAPFDRVFGSLPSDGWLTRGEAELLWRWVNLTQGPILEVGCYKGRSTCLLAATGRHVHCVDPFQGFSSEDPTGDATHNEWLGNINSMGFVNVALHRMDIADWNARSVGFAYLDGDHTYAGTEVQIAKALLCGAEVIAVHDVNDTGGGYEVKQAAIDHLGAWDERVERLAVWDRRTT